MGGNASSKPNPNSKEDEALLAKMKKFVKDATVNTDDPIDPSTVGKNIHRGIQILEELSSRVGKDRRDLIDGARQAIDDILLQSGKYVRDFVHSYRALNKQIKRWEEEQRDQREIERLTTEFLLRPRRTASTGKPLLQELAEATKSLMEAIAQVQMKVGELSKSIGQCSPAASPWNSGVFITGMTVCFLCIAVTVVAPFVGIPVFTKAFLAIGALSLGAAGTAGLSIWHVFAEYEKFKTMQEKLDEQTRTTLNRIIVLVTKTHREHDEKVQELNASRDFEGPFQLLSVQDMLKTFESLENLFDEVTSERIEGAKIAPFSITMEDTRVSEVDVFVASKFGRAQPYQPCTRRGLQRLSEQ
jgi:hypothetical protein